MNTIQTPSPDNRRNATQDAPAFAQYLATAEDRTTAILTGIDRMTAWAIASDATDSRNLIAALNLRTVLLNMIG